MRCRTLLPLITMLLAAAGVALLTVDAVRTGVWALGRGGAAELIPADFYRSAPVLPPAALEHAGVLVAVGILVIVASAAATLPLRR